MKHGKKFAAILVAILLALLVTMTASATQPTEIRGFFYFVDPFGPNDYCISTGESWGVPDGFLVGCVDQPEKPGLGAHGTFYLTVGELSGTCEYNLRTYEIDGIARFTANRCTGELAGFHMRGVGWAANGLWEGSYHFDP